MGKELGVRAIACTLAFIESKIKHRIGLTTVLFLHTKSWTDMVDRLDKSSVDRTQEILSLSFPL